MIISKRWMLSLLLICSTSYGQDFNFTKDNVVFVPEKFSTSEISRHETFRIITNLSHNFEALCVISDFEDSICAFIDFEKENVISVVSSSDNAAYVSFDDLDISNHELRSLILSKHNVTTMQSQLPKFDKCKKYTVVTFDNFDVRNYLENQEIIN